MTDLKALRKEIAQKLFDDLDCIGDRKETLKWMDAALLRYAQAVLRAEASKEMVAEYIEARIRENRISNMIVAVNSLRAREIES